MLSEYFEQPGRIRAIRNSPAGTHIEGFSEQLFERGYAELTARRHIRSAEHIVRWANRQGLCTEDLDDQVLKRFGKHLRRCHCHHFSSANPTEVLAGARLFLTISARHC